MRLTLQERDRLLKRMQDGYVETASFDAVQDVEDDLEQAKSLIARMGATLGLINMYPIDTKTSLKREAALVLAEAQVFLDGVTDQTPNGTPGVRDVRHPCPDYDPRDPELGDVEECEGDGHYLCKKCKFRKPEEE